MFDIGWSEMAIIMLVALIVIGPKDLPRVARNVGRWVGKGRALARDFQRQLEDMARDAELDKVKSEIEKAGKTDVKRSFERSIDPDGDLKSAFEVKEKGKGKDTAAAKENGDAGAASPDDGAGETPGGAGPVPAEPAAPPPAREPDRKEAATG